MDDFQENIWTEIERNWPSYFDYSIVNSDNLFNRIYKQSILGDKLNDKGKLR